MHVQPGGEYMPQVMEPEWRVIHRKPEVTYHSFETCRHQVIPRIGIRNNYSATTRREILLFITRDWSPANSHDPGGLHGDSRTRDNLTGCLACMALSLLPAEAHVTQSIYFWHICCNPT